VCTLAVPGFFVVAGIILVTGGLAGLRNWLAEDLDSPRPRLFLVRRLIDATLASASVPLFLSIVGNAKADAVFGELQIWNRDYQISMFILVGFCSLAALFSQRFLDSLSKKVMQLSDKVDDVKNKVDQAAELTAPLIEEDDVAALAPTAVAPDLATSANVNSVLRALTSVRFLVRSRTGLLGDTKLPPADLDRTLRELEERGLARKMSTTKGERWAPTEAGRFLATKPEKG
jgi:hypothetical protein